MRSSLDQTATGIAKYCDSKSVRSIHTPPQTLEYMIRQRRNSPLSDETHEQTMMLNSQTHALACADGQSRYGTTMRRENRKRVKPDRVFQNDWTSLRAPMVDRIVRLLIVLSLCAPLVAQHADSSLALHPISVTSV